MLENKKNVRKIRNIIISLMSILMTIVILINIKQNTTKEIEIETIATKQIENMKSAETEDFQSITTIADIQIGNGIIIPEYRPEWTIEKDENGIDKVYVEESYDDPETSQIETYKVLRVKIKGSAYKTRPIDSNVSINYASDVISTLELGDIQIFIDGENITDRFTNKSVATADKTIPMKELKTGQTSTNDAEKTEITYEFILYNFEEATRQTGKLYKEISGNVKLKITGRGKETGTYNENVLTDKYGSSVDGEGNVATGLSGNHSMMEIDENGTWLDITVGNEETNQNADGKMFADFIKPEFTYSSSTTVIGNGNNGDTKNVTVQFDVTDKYFKRTDLENDTNGELITVKVDQGIEANSKITKTLTKKAILVMNKESNVVTAQATDYTILSTELKVGERYELLISGLQQNPNDGFKYSGYVTLGFASEIIEDWSGNKNNGTTISIGLDENDGNSNEEDDVTGSGTIVDVVDPVWEVIQAFPEDGTIKIRGKDKFYSSNTLDEDKIKVLVNNSESTEITKVLSEPTYIKLDTDGNYVTTTNEEEAIGVEYILQLGNVTVSSGGYIGFVPTNADELVLNENGEAEYRIENGGNIKLEISEDTLVDKSGNKNIKTTLDAVNMDDTKPEIYDIQKTQDTTTKTETIIFNVTDRNYDPSDKITESEITFYIDGLPTTGVNILSLTSKEIKGKVSGITQETTQITTLGHQYTLVLNQIDETQAEFVAAGREYRELSGTLEVKIDEDAAKDMNLNTLNTETTTISDFVDFINPEVNYKYTESTQETPGDIDYSGKTFTMVFEILDKYIKESKLKTELENATNETEKQAVIEEFLTILIDSETPDWTEVGKELSIEEVEAENAFNKTVDGEIVNDTHVIGYKYTLVLSNLEQLQIKEGDKYLDYSGVITTAIEADIAKDTSGNGNIGTTITSGLDVIGNVQETGDGQVVDVVRPLIEKVSSSANAVNQTSTITFKATDKYYKQSTLTNENIELWINGSKVSSDMITGWESTNLTDETTSKQYGIQYTATITGFAQNVNQVKIRIPQGMIEDESENANVVTDLIVYNTLRIEDMEEVSTGGKYDDEIEAEMDVIGTKAFLGESITTEEATGTIIYINDLNEEYTPISRQDIEKIQFVNNLDELLEGDIPKIWDTTEKEWNIKDGIQRVWDISAQGDKSILAWTPQTTAPYTVYVGSTYEIFGNQNSRYLFAGIGSGASATATTTVVNLNALNTSSVTNMYSMFYKFGYKAMTSLDLENFDTSNVTNMRFMFRSCGYTKMTKLDLGEKFNTIKVTNMANMFNDCGLKLMQTLNLGDKFNTSNVRTMYSMFDNCGVEALENVYFGAETGTSGEIILPDNFNTSNVTNMSGMFGAFGVMKITSLDLGNSFNTNNVTDMSNMFNTCGAYEMTSLDLGDKFDTSNVTNMEGMFYACGYMKMSNFSLGDKFNTSKVTDMSTMFASFGRVLSNLDLGDKFDTSNVKDMSKMFMGSGKEFTSFDLGEKFDTSNVTDMYRMFYSFGTKLTSLDLGDKFDTSKVTDMNLMFAYMGPESMTKLDLGPHFTNIPDGTITATNSNGSTSTYGAHDKIFGHCGKEGELTIYAPESIYSSRTTFKLNRTSEVTVTPETLNTQNGEVIGTRGTIINPIYKPKWEKVQSTINVDEENLENSTISIELKGSANHSETISGTDVKINYSSNVTSSLTAEDILVYIDGELDNGEDLNNNGVLDEGEDLNGNGTLDKPSIQKQITPSNPETAANVIQTLTLSGFEEASRRTGLPFKELSGNIKIKILGRGESTETYGANVLVDQYGNQNMMETDEGQENGTWIDVTYSDTETDQNTNGTMFADFIKPEFTYEYSETTIGSGTTGDKKVKIVFDVTDKYFESTQLSSDQYAELITVQVAGRTLVGDTDKDGIIDRGEDTNLNGRLDEGEDINGNGTLDVGEDIRKTLTKTGIFVMNKTTKEVTVKSADYTITDSNTEQKVGERYELLIEGLQSVDGVGYSGPMTFAFEQGIIQDLSGNKNIDKSITIGIDDPTNHPEHNTPVIVDVINPIWTGPHDLNTINRTNDTVSITILGSDKYYANNTLDEDKITVYVDETVQGTISKTLTEITDTTQVATLAANAGLPSDVEVIGYTLTLGNFGTISGETKIVIEPGTIVDDSNNQNIETTIFAGNINWEETNEPLEEGQEGYPKYPAFRQDIVDFIDPVITYTYSTVEGSENPDIDYEEKTVTVKFTVTDKHILESSVIKADGTLNTTLVTINVDNEDVTDKVRTNITSSDITNGKEYTLTISNIEQEPNNGFDFSGPMQLIFEPGAIRDTSGNQSPATTITLDTTITDDVLDVVDPVISYSTSSIDRENNTVTLILKAEDKYISTETLSNSENVVKVKVIENDGTITQTNGTVKESTGTLIIEDTTTINKDIEVIQVEGADEYSMYFQVTLRNFGRYEGVTSIIIPEDLVKDTSGNGNKVTEILVGNTSDTTAFKDSIVDFTKPTWEYVTSTINRKWDEDGVRINGQGTVTLEVKGKDIYFDDKYYNNSAYELDLSKVNVYVDDQLNTTITKTFAEGTYKQYVTETDENGRSVEGVKYTIILGNFGTNDGKVRIEIPEDAIKDTSSNGNIVTPINVGNTEWIETDVDNATDPTDAKYDGFQENIVDFIKPVITKHSAVINRDDEKVQLIFDVTETNFLESIITLEDIQIFVDDDYEMDVTNVLTKDPLETTNITNGIRYTLTLSKFELESLLENEIFKRHSGIIKIVISKDKVADSSGNKNIETTIIYDQFTDDGETTDIVDFIDPIIYYDSQYINWNERYAEVTLKGTDRFYDSNSVLTPEMIKLYEQNTNGQYIEITNFAGKTEIDKNEIKDVYGNLLGYDYIIKLNDFEEEYKMKISIPAGYVDTDGTIVGLADTSGNLNKATEIEVVLDNKKPRWEYVSTDTTKFETDGEISFNVKGVDKFLDLTNSGLSEENPELIILKDGVNITAKVNITATYDADNSSSTEKSKAYNIKITGLTDEGLGESAVGTYSLVFAESTLVDEFENESAAKTITFSKSAISSNTENYTMVTYHVTPDNETTHNSYVHELMSVKDTGTNFENTTYRPSSLGELNNDGKNPLFAEPVGQSFAGWAEADGDGNIIQGGDVYGLYDEIENTVVHLKAIWQNATIVYVSNIGNNSNDGYTPTTPVKDLTTAYSKLNSSGTAENNIIVIMDEITLDNPVTLSGNATITSLYAGIDYRTTKDAELIVNSNITVDGDIIIDNIKISSNTTSNMLISNYSGDITLGRKITSEDYTFGTVIGGNYGTETTGNLGTHTIRIESGKYNNIIAGSTLITSTTTIKNVTHEVIIGNMRDTAISKNDKLIITGYLAIGENEQYCYPNDTEYANITLYSGTFTGTNKYANSSENAVIYLRSINSAQMDGDMKFEMYGGSVNGNIYGGSASETSTSDNLNSMNFYGGQVIGNILGQGATDRFIGNSEILLQGCFNITGNIFGGSNATTENSGAGNGNTSITLNSSSVTINGNIYGGSNGIQNSGYITGNTSITLNAGTVANIYGSGYNSGNSGTATITINNGTVSGNIFGGAHEAEGGNATITVLGGTVNNIYGGNENTTLDSNTRSQNINIVIGDTDPAKAPTINGTIYGSGKYDKIGTVEIQLIESANTTSVFGGSNAEGETTKTQIYLNGMTVNEIYGGGQTAGTVGTSNIYLQSGTVTDVYGGGYQAVVTTSNITLEGTATVGSIYGGSNTSGKVTTSVISLKSANSVTDIFGGGNSAEVTVANVMLEGMNVDTIHGGSKDAGVTGTTNVTLNSGSVTNVFGGGLDVGVTTSNIKHTNGATVTNIYGGNNSTELGDGGDTGTANITILNSEVTNVYGGNFEKGTTNKTNITIHGTSKVNGQIYGGGYKSAIGKSDTTGSTTINIAGGIIEGDINGGSEQGIVYGTTNIKIGKNATGNSSLTGSPIQIKGTIYGAGSSENSGYTDISVEGNTNILMDNIDTTSKITYSGSIFGSGKGTTYSTSGTDSDESTIILKNFGTLENTYQLVSIERTGKVFIGNSFIELLGRQDKYNLDKRASYTLNRITDGITLYNNTTLYTRRAFNMVGGFNSYSTYNFDTNVGRKASVDISGTEVTTNINNRLYTFEGVNLIFAKKEGDLSGYANSADNIWGEVNGMTFFGMYAINRTTGKKVFDIYAPDSNIYSSDYDGTISSTKFFANGTFIEGQHENSHNIEVDGFYTNVATYGDTVTITPQIIGVTDGGNYYDWIINEDKVTYSAGLIASISGDESMADILLDYKYVANATYEIDRTSTNALNTDVKLINQLEIPVISTNSHNTLGLIMETDTTGWLNKAETNIYTESSYDGDRILKSDNSSTPGTIRFKLYNSANITESKDLGFVNIVLVAKTPELVNEDGSITAANTFKIVITLNLQTEAEEQNGYYVPRFTNNIEKELHYTSDSKVDLTYTLYKETTINPYTTGDYRVLTTSTQLPAGTRITMKDYAKDKIYYYHVTGTETEYKLSNFLEMDSTDNYYTDDDTYYNSTDGYVLEKYDISIDFIDSGISGNLTNQQTYLELRSSGGVTKYNNGNIEIKYNLYSGKNAVMTQTISNNGQTYSVVENTELEFTLNASIIEQKTADGKRIRDTKYYDQIGGIVVEILDPNDNRVMLPEVQNVKLINIDDQTEEHVTDESGVIRIPLMETLSSISKNYKMTISQNNVAPGKCSVNVYFFESDNGEHIGDEEKVENKFYAIFVNKLLGLVGIEATDDSRIINKSTGLNLEGNSGIDMTVSIGDPTEQTNLRIELYKRIPTYTSVEDETTYTGTQYTLVDLEKYLQGTWETPEEAEPPTVDENGDTTDEGLITDGQYQYILLPRQTYESSEELISVDLETALKENVSTGEYKIVIKSYHDNILLQTVRKTFMVTE